MQRDPLQHEPPTPADQPSETETSKADEQPPKERRENILPKERHTWVSPVRTWKS